MAGLPLAALTYWGMTTLSPLPLWAQFMSNLLVAAVLGAAAVHWRLRLPPGWGMGRRERGLVAALAVAVMAAAVLPQGAAGAAAVIAIQASGVAFLTSLYLRARSA